MQATPAAPVAPFAAPSAPAATATGGSGQITVSWAAPTSAAPVVTYTVSRGATAGASTPYITLPATSTSYVDLLGAAGTYFYTVTATSAGGTSAASVEVMAAAAAPAVPGAPAVTATGGGGSVVLAWPAPSANGTPITSYTVSRGSTPGSEVSVATLPGGATSWTDSSATGGTVYYYTVAATNSTGTSAASSEVSAAASMPVAVDSAAGVTQTTTANSASWTHTVGSLSHGAAIVAVAQPWSSAPAFAPSSVTFGGQAMSHLGTQMSASSTGTSTRSIDLYYLLTPPPGAQTITVNIGHSNNFEAASVTLANVSQSNPFGTPVSTATSAANATTQSAVTSTVASPIPDLVLAAGMGKSTTNLTAPGGQTVQITELYGNNAMILTTQTASSTTTTSTVSQSVAEALGVIAVPVHAG